MFYIEVLDLVVRREGVVNHISYIFETRIFLSQLKLYLIEDFAVSVRFQTRKVARCGCHFVA